MEDKFIETQERLLTSSYDKASSYSQVVLGIGYVSIFAAWGFTKEFLTRGEVLWSALLACISVFFFVIFDVVTMFIASRSVLELARSAQDPHAYLQAIEAHQKKEKRLSAIYARIWIVCWPVSFLTGIGSAGILMWAFVSHLLSGK